MRIIKVSATESTNSLAREWYQLDKKKVPFCIIAEHQIAGRGQRGTSWVSNRGENLTMSVVYSNPRVGIQDQFLLSATVALAILEPLKELKINNLKLKWPNDIMSANQKIGGILIENILSNGRITAAIIGLGLNVNQMTYSDLPKAASLRSVSGRSFDIDELAAGICRSIENKLNDLGTVKAEELLKDYEGNLFRKNKVSTFLFPNGDLLTGIIKGITPTGLLKVMVEDEALKLFDLKEIKLLF
ncbi:MAG TPA: biotin--[acetyl-CoA-carboxylase] ligase [Gillisia sp.]|nr:biotin--[acetyl-CoA-carboxylase] ligase [Gillisia sp.]